MEMITLSLVKLQLSITGVIFTSAIIFLIVLWCYKEANRKHFDKLTINMRGPPSYPIIGTWPKFSGTNQRLMESIIKQSVKYGSEPSKFWMGSVFNVTIMKPEDVQIVFNNSKALQKGSIYNLFRNILGDGLFTASIDKWRMHRRIIGPAFTTNHLKQYFNVFNDTSQNLVTNLKREVGQKQKFDLWDYVANTALDTICRTTMGYNLDTQLNNDSEFAKAFIKASELDSIRIFNPLLRPNIIFSIYLRLTGQHNVLKTLHKLPNKVIQEKTKIFEQRKISNNAGSTNGIDKEKKVRKLLLDTLMELNGDYANFSDEDLKDEVLTFMLGGMETSAITVCFCLLLLAIHQDIQDKVYDEIYNIFGDDNRSISFDDTLKLVYLNQVLEETMRLYPVGPMVIRLLQDDVKIFSDNITLPKGTTCNVSVFGTHHMPELYPNPWAFNPDNFSPDNVAKRHRYSFIAFSGGQRNCIGSKYAMLSMKVLISTFLRNYSVHTDIQLCDIKLTIGLLMRSVHGYPVTIKPREK